MPLLVTHGLLGSAIITRGLSYVPSPTGPVTIAPSGQTFEVPINVDDSWEITVHDVTGAAVVFSGTESLSAVVWPGGSTLPAFTPSATWVESGAGRFKLAVGASQTANLGTGIYAMQAFVTSGGLRQCVYDGALSITKTVGTTVSGRAYTTFERMKVYAPWLQLVHDQDNDQAGYQSQIEEASRWLEGLVQRHYRGNSSGSVPTDYSLDHLFWGLQRRSLLPSNDLVTWLGANGLMTTFNGVDLGVSEVVAKYAIGLVAQGRIGPTGGSQYAATAASYLNAAEEKAKALTVIIDTNNDGTPDVWIDLGSTDSVYA